MDVTQLKHKTMKLLLSKNLKTHSSLLSFPDHLTITLLIINKTGTGRDKDFFKKKNIARHSDEFSYSSNVWGVCLKAFSVRWAETVDNSKTDGLVNWKRTNKNGWRYQWHEAIPLIWNINVSLPSSSLACYAINHCPSFVPELFLHKL